jgi:hypothetical protein
MPKRKRVVLVSLERKHVSFIKIFQAQSISPNFVNQLLGLEVSIFLHSILVEIETNFFKYQHLETINY